jgi:glycosyltransferase involved in cell wall biosynthesis
MATFNGAEFLSEQLNDLLQQTVPPTEIVVSDDASTDGTDSLLRSFAAMAHCDVKIIRNKTRIGYRRNFMQAAASCSGDLVAFCDQDDRWSRRKLEHVRQPFDDPEILLAFHNAEVVTCRGESLGRLTSEPSSIYPPLTTSPWMFPRGFTQVFRRTLLQIPGWESSVDHCSPAQVMAHDQWFVFLASVLGKIAFISESLARYRQHEANAFGWKSRSLGQFVSEVLDASSRYEGFSSAFEARARILEASQEVNLSADWRERLVTGQRAYQVLAHRYKNRAQIYTCRDVRGRILPFSRLLREHAYAQRPWPLGGAALAKDVVLGVSGLVSSRLQLSARSEP